MSNYRPYIHVNQLPGADLHAPWEVQLVLGEVEQAANLTEIIFQGLFHNVQADEQVLQNYLREAGTLTSYEGTLDNVDPEQLRDVMEVVQAVGLIANEYQRAIRDGDDPTIAEAIKSLQESSRRL